MVRFLSLLVTALIALPGAEGPNDFETSSLCLLNRLRADPVTEGRLLAAIANQFPGTDAVDLSMFRREMDAYEPVPPVVFDMSAITAARNHAAYIIQHGSGHIQDPKLPGFTGRNLADRLEHVNFPGQAGAENVFLTALTPIHGHAGFVIDYGAGGSGGMQKDRGHRVSMLRPRYNVVGIGAISHGTDLFALTHAFGIMEGRFVGGAMFEDLNGNGQYDPGEGRQGQLRLLPDGDRVKSWASGAFTLPLPGRQGGELELHCEGKIHRVRYEPGILNTWVTWSIPGVD